MTSLSPSRAVIDLNAYAHNLRVVRQMIPKECAVLAVVKADAYGHGAVRVAQRAVAEGVAMLGVATVQEGVELREAGIEAPVLVLIQPEEDALAAAVTHDLRLTLSDVRCAHSLGELARRANRVPPVHCQIDTGLGRQGFDMDGAVAALHHLTRISHIDIEGVSTHFSAADEPDDPLTAEQIRRFKHLLRELEKGGIPYEITHAANSAGIVAFPSSAFDMVRPGLMSYGAWPTAALPDPSPLIPVMRWEAPITLLKEVPADWGISYGHTYVTPRHVQVAIVPVGYGDGYKRALSNRAEVLVRGRRCPVRGRVCMDQIVIDVTAVEGVSIGDTATLLGADGSEAITANELAERAGTIPNDLFTGIGKRVERVYGE